MNLTTEDARERSATAALSHLATADERGPVILITVSRWLGWSGET